MDVAHAQPIGMIVNAYLWLHSKTSLRARLFGADPTKTPSYITNNEGRWINRDTLVDVYALAWPLASCLLLAFISASSIDQHNLGILASAAAAYRLNELFGGVFYVLVLRARYDRADGRKLAISFLAYLEPILIFSILHGSAPLILARGGATAASGVGYVLGGRSWNWITMLHYSIGCYTTVGWGDISATSTYTMGLSDLETVMGIVMLACTISRLVAAALDSSLASGPSPDK